MIPPIHHLRTLLPGGSPPSFQEHDSTDVIESRASRRLRLRREAYARRTENIRLTSMETVNADNLPTAITSTGAPPPNMGAEEMMDLPLGLRRQVCVNLERHTLRRMDSVCGTCRALLWIEERSPTSSAIRPTFSICCSQGKVTLPTMQNPPSPLLGFLTGSDPTSRSFRNNIRAYNSVLAFTSMGARVDERFSGAHGGVPNFRIHGEMYHLMGSLLPDAPDARPQFAQLYIYDTANEVDNRLGIMQDLDREVVAGLQGMLHSVNPYVAQFRQVSERLTQDPATPLRMVIRADRASDPRRYNAPSGSEVAVIMLDNGNQEHLPRDITLQSHGGGLQRISETHRSYSALHYVLLFPRGEDGWHPYLPQTDSGPLAPRSNAPIPEIIPVDTDRAITRQTRVTQAQYFSYRLQVREEEGKTLHLSGRLFQQYVVDAYAITEQNRLQWIRFNQQNIRADLYQGLQDAIHQSDSVVTGSTVGTRIVLPSTFTGSPRHMHQLYQDAMAIVRTMGSPDMFVTFTCNPRWPEITCELLPGQSSIDRPDLTARVFNLKLRALLDDLLKKGILGKVVGHIYTVEFQKRGLPHAHILLILEAESKPRTEEDIDRIVSAEIPCPEMFPLAHDTVTRSMMHGPCGRLNMRAPCMQEGVCTKRYPKLFRETTSKDTNGYPLYRRIENGITTTVAGISLDNRWIVPHNLYLATKYNAHINVEICTSITAVKYLFKYVYKGHDRATVEIRNQGTDEQREQPDEIRQYLDVRYVSASESIWRLFGFRMHQERPDIQRLQVHLPNRQLVHFQDRDDLSEVLQRPNIGKTTLTEWFTCNREDEQARQYTYSEFPMHYTWKRGSCTWARRLRGNTIGRVFFVHPGAGERYYLRMLLNVIKGATSYEHLRTINGIAHNSFKEACAALGLLSDDREWEECIAEAGRVQTGAQLRGLFAIILLFCEPTYPARLWERHQASLTDDILAEARRQARNPGLEMSMEEIESRGLCHLSRILREHGKSLEDIPGMPLPQLHLHQDQEDLANHLIQEQNLYNPRVQQEMMEEMVPRMNDGQREAYEVVIAAVESEMQSAFFFLDGPGGSGKTFLYQAILAKVRGNGHIALAVASSGIAALLLTGGRTAHSRFKIPLNLSTDCTCSISVRSQMAELIKKARIIVWDEAPMIHRYAFEAVDRTLRDVMRTVQEELGHQPFGGKVVLAGGDFRQVLPVVPRGGREEVVGASLRRSPLWRHAVPLRLTINMRLRRDDSEGGDAESQFSEWLLRVGEGREPMWGRDLIRIWPEMVLPSSGLNDLVEFVYPRLSYRYNEQGYLEARGILAGRNDEVDAINEHVLQTFPGEEVEYLSADSVDQGPEGGDQELLPVEFLNSLKPGGSLPPHKLRLKIGVPIMLLRNLDPSKGLCNGTRLICRGLQRRVIEAVVITGAHQGTRVFIPRITLSPATHELPFTLKRLQFPVRLAFGMTINKSQGQTMSYVGLYLNSPVFCHGQLYVALSRVTSRNNIKVVVSENSFITEQGERYPAMRNVVYPEIL